MLPVGFELILPLQTLEEAMVTFLKDTPCARYMSSRRFYFRDAIGYRIPDVSIHKHALEGKPIFTTITSLRLGGCRNMCPHCDQIYELLPQLKISRWYMFERIMELFH